MSKWPTWNPKGPHRILFPCPDCNEALTVLLGYTPVKVEGGWTLILKALEPAVHDCTGEGWVKDDHAA